MSEKIVSRGRRSLAGRMLAACEAVPALDKNGRNDEYNYCSASQLLEVFRTELFKRDVLILPNDLELIEHEVPTIPGVILNRVTLKTEYEFRDCLGKEPSILKTAFGSGIDGGDKALYKAKTGSIKYLLRILGMIPWNDADPESDLATNDLTDPRTFDTKKGKTTKASRLAARQIRAFDSACHASGKTAQQVADYLRATWSTATVADLPKQEFNEAIKWATQASDLRQQIQESLVAANSRKKANGATELLATQATGD